MNRRAFIKTAAAATIALPTVGAGLAFAEAVSIRVEHISHRLPNLPSRFEGMRLAFLTDIHHGPYTNLDYLVRIVRTTMQLQPDVICHGGDFTLRTAKNIDPAFDVLKELAAPLGVYGVLGNHDYHYDVEHVKTVLRASGVELLVNRGVWLKRGPDRLRLAGVDDAMLGKPNAELALGDCTARDACVLLSHNPDVAETLDDPRVGLMLAGHTHGGQANIASFKNPFIPSKYGSKYLRGFAKAPSTTVYTSRGLGMTAVPMRWNCPPELTLLTLTAK